jgi:hypothetical protein
VHRSSAGPDPDVRATWERELLTSAAAAPHWPPRQQAQTAIPAAPSCRCQR